ncbi:MAG: dTDP-4-dehydrorhamnose reductase [Gammaproteobacteria bacterium]|nr:dTDP-4-dehydrorhamnose reductase [Gammaproteobacteria bacterium]MDH5801234.1 dTDP-4-dehydrorhamnose reductase [Gammaproteobacteria bacterium]
MKIWLSGANGQLGWEINQMAQLMPQYQVLALDRNQLDITDQKAVRASMQSFQPDIAINAAAYTAVDKAETEVELAYAVNRDGPAYIAQNCAELGIPMIHISTDYVFDGAKSEPYVETDPVNPINVYGKSKLEGELAVAKHLREHIILRTSWVFGRQGNNFVKTMIRLLMEKDEFGVVKDQQGCPTYTGNLARAVLKVCESDDRLRFGVFHYCDNPETTWYEFAEFIRSALSQKIEISNKCIRPILTTEYPTPAKRPKSSCLRCDKFVETYDYKIDSWNLGMLDVVDTVVASLGERGRSS